MPSAESRNSFRVVITPGRGETITKINSVTVKNTESDFATQTLNASKYLVSNDKKLVEIIDKRERVKITVDYEVDLTEEEFEKRFGKEAANSAIATKTAIAGNMRGIVESMKVEKLLSESSPYNKIGESIGGFKSLTTGGVVQKSNTNKARVVQMGADAADGNVTVLTGNADALKKLTGSTVIPTSSFLKSDFTNGNPAAVLQTIKKKLPNLNPKKLTEFASKIKPATSSLNPKTFDKLGDVVEKLDKGITPAKQVTDTVKKEHKSQLDAIGNPATKLNPLGMVTSAARSASNISAHSFGAIANKVKSGITGDPFQQISSLAKGIKLKAGQVPAPNVLENLNTNLSSNFKNGTGIAETEESVESSVQSRTNNTDATSSKFAGYNTPDNYPFTFVKSPASIVNDFKKPARGPASNNDRSIRGLIITTTDPLWGDVERVNALEIHKLNKKVMEKNIISEVNPGGTKTSVEAKQEALNKLKSSGKEFGIQAHYIILANGDLQRGRPISEIRSPRFAIRTKSAVEVCMVANGENPPTPEQMKTLEIIIENFYIIFPAGVVRTFDELDPKASSLINVENYRVKYKKSNDLSDKALDEIPTKFEKSLTPPSDIVKPTKTKANQIVTLDDIVEKFDRINEVDGSVIEKDIDASLTEMDNILNGINGKSNDKLSAVENAKHLAAGDKFRAGLNKDILDANSFLDKQTKSFDDTLKNVKLGLDDAVNFSKKVGR